MEKFKERQFTSRYNKIMFVTFLVVISISAALITIQIDNQTKHDTIQLIEQFKTRSIAIDNLIVSITEHLNLMQTKAEAFFLDTKQVNNSIFFKALSKTDTDFYSLDNIPSPYSKDHLGNLTGKGNIAHFSKSLREEIEMSLSLNSLFQATKQNIPNSAWVYYTSKDKFINIYPWTPSGQFKFSEELYTHEFYNLGIPSANPEKKIFWTAAYIDEYGKGMMVTAAKPIYRGDEFLGTVAIDITLDKLTEYVQNFRGSMDILMILNAQHQLIAHPTLTSSKDKEVKLFKNALPAILQFEQDHLFKNQSLNPSRLNSYLYIWYEMKNAPWKIIFISQEQPLLVPPSEHDSENIGKVVNQIKKHVRQDKTNVYVLLNHFDESTKYSGQFDFEIPFLPERVELTQEKFVVPDQVHSVINKLVDRVERVHQISVFIPTTIDVDKAIDTSDYVRKTLVFFGEKFGGATCSEAQGVWNSNTSGIVNEVVHVVVTYTTEEDLSRSVDDVIEFVKSIKAELNQEAMAIEINRKMILI